MPSFVVHPVRQLAYSHLYGQNLLNRYPPHTTTTNLVYIFLVLRVSVTQHLQNARYSMRIDASGAADNAENRHQPLLAAPTIHCLQQSADRRRRRRRQRQQTQGPFGAAQRTRSPDGVACRTAIVADGSADTECSAAGLPDQRALGHHARRRQEARLDGGCSIQRRSDVDAGEPATVCAGENAVQFVPEV